MYTEIKTNRLLLRPLEVQDLAAIHTYASDPENTRFMLFLPNETEEETRQFLQRAVDEWEKEVPHVYEFGILLEAQLIGAVSVSLDETRAEGELGWILNKRYWKQGYAAEAALAVKKFAAKELGVAKLTAHCDARNRDSYRLMEKIGLRLESDDGIRTYPKSGETALEITCFCVFTSDGSTVPLA